MAVNLTRENPSLAAAPVQRNLLWISVVLCVPAAISTIKGFRNALGPNRSQDFQWSGAHLFASGQDPYLTFLLKDPRHQIMMSQVPNYLHELYVLLWPFGYLTEHVAAIAWAVLNLLFALVSIVALGRIFGLSRSMTTILGFLLALSTPFRIALGNGQQCLLELMLISIALAFPAKAQWPLGLSYFKFSFAPIIFFFVFFKKAYRTVSLSIIIPVIGWLIFSIRVGGSPLRTAIEPVLAGRMGVSPGTVDLVSLLMLLAPRWVPVGILITFVLSGLLAYIIEKKATTLPQAAAALAPCSLLLFPHLTYDFVLLIIPIAWFLRPNSYALSGWKTSSFTVLLILLIVVPSLPTFRNPVLSQSILITTLLLLALSVLRSDGPDRANLDYLFET